MIRMEVWGPYALFSRPELKVERMSYEVITPSAARGILESVMWKPAIKYVIDKIYIMKPIQVTNIRRNEVKSKASASNILSVMNGGDKPLYINTSSDIQQRASLVLKDVRYVIEAHFEMTDKAGPEDSQEKFYAMISRRLRNGQCYHQPYLGCREFPAYFKLWEDKGEIKPECDIEEKDLGLMLYDMDFSDRKNIRPMFFRAKIENGIVDLKDCEVFS